MAEVKVLWAGEHLNCSIGRQILLDDAQFSIRENERVALVGRNGSGKSTFLRIVSAQEEPSSGEISVMRNCRISLMEQQCGKYASLTVGETLKEGMSLFYETLEKLHSLKDNSPEQETLERFLTIHDAWDPEVKLNVIADKLHLPSPDRICGELSGGELRRLLLARAIVSEPDLLLLDEPTNHLDVETIRWIEEYLSAYRGTCLFITHDRFFLDRIATRIVELDHGKFFSCEGSYADFLAAKEEREYREDVADAKRKSFLRREIEWVRRSPKARLKRNIGRIKRYEATAAIQSPERIGNMELMIPQAMRLGNQVLSLKEISLALGGKQLFRNFSFVFEAGQKVGIIGPNGAGKTTLLKLMTGQIRPDSGKVECAPTVVFNYIGQSHLELDPEKSILEEIGQGRETVNLGDESVTVRAYLKRFLFEDERVNTKIGLLSGGERARIALAKILKGGGNFLMLDEPTNDLDLPTMRVLEESLISYTGCLAVVSHDRYFLNRVCTHVIAFEPDGTIFQGPGDYDYYEEHRKAVLPAPAPKEKKPEIVREKKTPKKLSYREERELEEVEKTIGLLEEKISSMEAQFAEADFYAKHGKEYPAMQQELDQLKQNRDNAMLRWEELEQKKEDLRNEE